ncbi:MAG: FHA domain-containing protein [Victivallales bacterium]
MTNIPKVKSDEFRTLLMVTSDVKEIRLDEVKNRIRHIDNLLESFDQPPSGEELLLIVVKGKPHTWFALESDLISIGRAESSDIVLQSSKVSRNHCHISRNNNSWLMVDDDSRNGLFVNGRKMKKRFLCEGDIVRIGTGSVELIYIRNRKPDFI